MAYLCNPMNIPYRYQFFKVRPEIDDLCEIHREAADPSLIVFLGRKRKPKAEKTAGADGTKQKKST